MVVLSSVGGGAVATPSLWLPGAVSDSPTSDGAVTEHIQDNLGDLCQRGNGLVGAEGVA
jgi:hypothetical protein